MLPNTPDTLFFKKIQMFFFWRTYNSNDHLTPMVFNIQKVKKQFFMQKSKLIKKQQQYK